MQLFAFPPAERTAESACAVTVSVSARLLFCRPVFRICILQWKTRSQLGFISKSKHKESFQRKLIKKL